MAQTEEGENRARQQFASLQMSSFTKDLLLQRLVSGKHFDGKFEDPNEELEEEEEEIELSLGLSMNGRFGVDPRASKKLALKRSSSIADLSSTTHHSANEEQEEEEEEEEGADKRARRRSFVPKASPAPLIRTCSLPTETEEEWRKRKELQTLRRMEAKRKRLEKVRNLKAARDRGSKEDSGEEQCVKVAADEFSRMGMFSWVSNSGSRPTSGSGVELNGVRAGVDGLPPQPLSHQRSIASPSSGGSSGTSSIESPTSQGLHTFPEAKSTASVQQSEQKSRMIITEKSGDFSKMEIANQPDKPTSGNKEAKETARNVLEDMPCVSTKGDGPNGRRIEGFLYRYRKGEEVRIVCVCHGSFLSPAEFVKHAGGGDVAHPLKHIVVSPTFF